MRIPDEAVRIVVYEQDAVFAGKSDQTLEQILFGQSSGRHVRIVDNHQLDALHSLTFDLLEIGLPSVRLAQFVIDTDSAGDLCRRTIGRITRVGHQYLVSGFR